jgi:hypothetical protein
MSLLTSEERSRTASWIAGRQEKSGAIAWLPGRKLDPWDHIQSAMGLARGGHWEEAYAAFRFLVRTQDQIGAWPAASTASVDLDPARETNHAAYLAAGLWYVHRCRDHTDFLAEMWPMLDRAISFVVDLQDESGAIWWARNVDGVPWKQPLLTGSSSIHGSLVCAERIAAHLGHDRPEWKRSRRKLATALRGDGSAFASSPSVTSQFSMDWYYPVLGGAVRGDAARQRIRSRREQFIGEGMGCRCVVDFAWYTVAETCELAMALDTCGYTDQAHAMLHWTRGMRVDDGGYWIGIAYPDGRFFPAERPTWTAATVLLANDVLEGESATSSFFRDLAGD